MLKLKNECLLNRKKFNNVGLSKILINKGINVELYYSNNKVLKNTANTISRTIGLSNNSIEFLEGQKILCKKDCWDIKRINLYRGNNSKSFLSFNSKKIVFYDIL